MNLKLLAVFCSLAVVGATPEPAGPNLLGDLVTAKLIGGLLTAKKPAPLPVLPPAHLPVLPPAHLPVLSPAPVAVPNILLFNGLAQLIKGLTHLTGEAPKQLAKVTKLPVPGTVNDIVLVVITVGLVIKGVLNVLLAGAGTVFANVLLGLVKIIVCGASKGKALFSTLPAVCGANYGVQWHLKPYNGGYDNIKKIIEFYEIQKIGQTIKETVKKVTKGVGLVALVGSARYIVRWVLQLTKIFSNVKKTWTTIETALVISKIVTIIGGIANSYKRGLGEDVAKGIITYICLSPHSALFGGKELQQRLDSIVKHINKCDKHSLNGALNSTNRNTKPTSTAAAKVSVPTSVTASTNVAALTKDTSSINVAASTNSSNDGVYDDDYYYYSGEYYYDDYGAIINGTEPTDFILNSSESQNSDKSAA